MASRRKDVVKAGNLASKVQEILDIYGKDVTMELEEVTYSVAMAGAKKIQQNAKGYGWGSKYANGWTVTDTSTRLTKHAVIHHSTAPGLPHLLENGHVTYWNGKRVKDARSFEHIAPVEEEIIKLYEEKIKQGIEAL